jgi:hypothetical protein
MASSPSPDDPTMARDDRSPPGTPRWVKVFGIIALALVLALVIGLLTGRGGPGGHGPGRHGGGGTPSVEARFQTAPLGSVRGRGAHRPPAGAAQHDAQQRCP